MLGRAEKETYYPWLGTAATIPSRSEMSAGTISRAWRAALVDHSGRATSFVNVEEEFAGEGEATKEAAHRAAGTFGVMIRLVMADLEAEGKIYRTGEMRDGRPVFTARGLVH